MALRADWESVSRCYRMDDRVVVVTGAASGIGAETCAVLGAAGATVVCADVDTDGLERHRRSGRARPAARPSPCPPMSPCRAEVAAVGRTAR